MQYRLGKRVSSAFFIKLAYLRAKYLMGMVCDIILRPENGVNLTVRTFMAVARQKDDGEIQELPRHSLAFPMYYS